MTHEHDKIIEDDEDKYFFDEKSLYKLVTREKHDNKQLTTPSDRVYFEVYGNSDVHVITSRDFEEYISFFSYLELNPAFVYVEVGAGLGGFIPGLVEKIKPKNKPTIIDPADYQTMYSLLKYSLKNNIPETDKQYVRELIKRCEIINDTAKVNFINTTLGDAVGKHSELRSVADVVIDLFGAAHYAPDYERTWHQCVFMVKKGGIVFTKSD